MNSSSSWAGGSDSSALLVEQLGDPQVGPVGQPRALLAEVPVGLLVAVGGARCGHVAHLSDGVCTEMARLLPAEQRGGYRVHVPVEVLSNRNVSSAIECGRR